MNTTAVLLGATALIVILICPAASAQSVRFGFKLTGALSYHLGGDSTASLQGSKLRWEDIAGLRDATLDQSITPLASHFGLEFEADAIVYLNPQFGITLGTGYVRAGTMFGSGTQIYDAGGSKEIDAHDVSATATPIKIGVYYNFQSNFIQTGGKSTSYVFGGVGFYSARFAQTENWSYQSIYSNYTETSKASGLGLFGGFGTETWLNPNFAWIAEFYGRYASISGFTGDWQVDNTGSRGSGTGKLYYYEWLDGTTAKWYPTAAVLSNAPSGALVRNARPAKIDFSGLGIRIGIKVAL